MPPTYHFEDLSAQARSMAKDCGNERLAMILQYVTLGSMIVMTGIAASKVLRDVFGPTDRCRGGGRER